MGLNKLFLLHDYSGLEDKTIIKFMKRSINLFFSKS